MCPQCKSGFVEELENNVPGRVSSDESNDVPPMRAGFIFEPVSSASVLDCCNCKLIMLCFASITMYYFLG